jgi:hypothetical protein
VLGASSAGDRVTVLNRIPHEQPGVSRIIPLQRGRARRVDRPGNDFEADGSERHNVCSTARETSIATICGSADDPGAGVLHEELLEPLALNRLAVGLADNAFKIALKHRCSVLFHSGAKYTYRGLLEVIAAGVLVAFATVIDLANEREGGVVFIASNGLITADQVCQK